MGFRLVTANLNGIRSATAKGFGAWAAREAPDCMGVQEVKAQAEDLQVGGFEQLGDLQGHFHLAQKKGYSGVGLYSRHEPTDVLQGFGHRGFDAEGRWVELRFDRPGQRFSVISCYFPSGSSSEERQAAKFRFLARMYPHLMRLRARIYTAERFSDHAPLTIDYAWTL